MHVCPYANNGARDKNHLKLCRVVVEAQHVGVGWFCMGPCRAGFLGNLFPMLQQVDEDDSFGEGPWGEMHAQKPCSCMENKESHVRERNEVGPAGGVS